MLANEDYKKLCAALRKFELSDRQFPQLKFQGKLIYWFQSHVQLPQRDITESWNAPDMYSYWYTFMMKE